MDPPTSDPIPGETTWRVCPVCGQPNSLDVKHCEHCWGASLYQVRPVDSDELLAIIERNELRARRRRGYNPGAATRILSDCGQLRGLTCSQ